jgi:hypothetical protein
MQLSGRISRAYTHLAILQPSHGLDTRLTAQAERAIRKIVVGVIVHA